MKLDVGMLTHDLKTIPELRPQGGGARLRLPVVGRDPARPVPAAGGGRDVDQPHPTRDLHRGGVPAQPHGPGPHLVGPRQGLGRTLHPGAGLAGEGPQRAALLGEVGGAGAAHARGGAGAARHLGLLAERDQAQLQGAVLPVRPHDAVLQPRPHRAPQGAGLRRGREPAHVPRRRRGVRRPARASVQQPEVPARARAAGGQRGPREVGPRPRATSPTRPRASWWWATPRPSRRKAAPGGEAADRLLRLHPHLRAGAGRPRLAGSRSRTCTASRWRATGRAWPISSPTRWWTSTRSPAPTTTSAASSGALRRAARPHRVLPARQAAEPRRSSPAAAREGIQRIRRSPLA